MVTLDTAFDLLADARRRYLLYYLREHETAPVEELADAVAGWRGPAGGEGDIAPAEHERARTALVHVHLPKLADAGVVTFDHDDATATLASVPPVLDAPLDFALAVETGVDAEPLATAEREGWDWLP
jgi:predicted transcriptional regulator